MDVSSLHSNHPRVKGKRVVKLFERRREVFLRVRELFSERFS